MTPELEEEIIKKYPKIFHQEDEISGEVHITCSYFQCGDGWYTLIDMICKHIQYYVDSMIGGLDEEERKYFQVVVREIKEKYGSLRFSVDGGDEYIAGMITMVEAMSGKICEECGNKSEIKTKGWIQNLCQSCYDKINMNK